MAAGYQVFFNFKSFLSSSLPHRAAIGDSPNPDISYQPSPASASVVSQLSYKKNPTQHLTPNR